MTVINSPKRIGISARWLSLTGGGAKEYTINLIKTLLRIDDKNEYVIFLDSKKYIELFPNASVIYLPMKSKLYWDYIQLPSAIKIHKIDLFWTPSYIIPFPIKCKSVASVLDLAYYKLPKSYKVSDVLYMQSMIPGSLKRASAILAISEYTKKDLIQLFPFAMNKITVTHLAASTDYHQIFNKSALELVRKKYGIFFPFIFYAGSLSPRKGWQMLLEAFAILKKNNLIPHKLVFTGGMRWGSNKLEDLVTKFGLEKEILLLGEVPIFDLVHLYNLAEVFVYPSFYEGFGLPLLEAMACGCPVICSNSTSLPEVVGDAALLINPQDLSNFVESMRLILVNKELRESQIQKGFVRSKQFSWDLTAQKTLTVFNQVLS